MDEGPERVWVFRYSDQYENPVSDKPSEDHTDKEDEYVRADIAKAERDAAFALGLEAVAKLAMFEYRSRLDRQITSGSLTGIGMMHGQVAEAMLTLAKQASALAPKTPLQAALALPEVREFVEAARQLRHAVCGETGFANAVRLDTGRAYPWPALDLADDALCAAFSKLEAKG